jgi:ABC-type phosphonate transport system ATPase subunit
VDVRIRRRAVRAVWITIAVAVAVRVTHGVSAATVLVDAISALHDVSVVQQGIAQRVLERRFERPERVRLFGEIIAVEE